MTDEQAHPLSEQEKLTVRVIKMLNDTHIIRVGDSLGGVFIQSWSSYGTQDEALRSARRLCAAKLVLEESE